MSLAEVGAVRRISAKYPFSATWDCANGQLKSRNVAIRAHGPKGRIGQFPLWVKGGHSTLPVDFFGQIPGSFRHCALMTQVRADRCWG